MFSALTVRESLTFAARLRLPAGEGGLEAQQCKVSEVIELLKLTKCQDTRIGDARARGVSGGERLAILLLCVTANHKPTTVYFAV